ncbi:MAG: ClpX C4-type zinc finger protein [Streptosporangiaceae bacterium]
MPLDADLLNQAKTAETRAIDAEYHAVFARTQFHQAVRQLQLAGASLREIADALGLSHQRVHQMVAGAGGSRPWRQRQVTTGELQSCSFCGRDQKHVKLLMAGPGVFICGGCIRRAHAALVTGKAIVTPEVTIRRVRDEARAERCDWCGKRRYQVPAMASGGQARICAECLRLCHEIMDEAAGHGPNETE